MDEEKQIIWDTRLFALAKQVGEWSSDPSRKVGSVIVGHRNDVRALGYNGLPRNVEDTSGLFERPLKYLWIEHAERNAIYSAARGGVPLVGCRMYVSWFPCADCARAIVQVGLSEVVCVEPDWEDPVWSDHFAQSMRILNAGSIGLRFYKNTEDTSSPVKSPNSPDVL
jgi:dCMP deaminase